MPAKKKTTKKVSKKTARKKTAKKKKKAPVCVNGEQCFWTSDGQILSSLVDLGNALEHMADEVFKHHVTKDKNDFADWIEHVLSDKELAKKIRSSKKPKTARTVVVRRLKIYDV